MAVNAADCRVLVGMPAHRTVELDTVKTLIGMVKVSLKFGIHVTFAFAQGCDIARARNSFVRRALDLGCTHLLMLDADMTTDDYEFLIRLLAIDMDVIGASYAKRDGSGTVLSSERMEDGNYRTMGPFYDVREVDAVGTGAMLIKTEVFRKMESPWFMFEAVDGVYLSEDTNFCRKVKDLGLKVWADGTIKMGHIGTKKYFVGKGDKR